MILGGSLDPEDYPELWVDMHEVFCHSDEFARHVTREWHCVQARIEAADWDGDEGLMALRRAQVRLKRELKRLGLEDELTREQSAEEEAAPAGEAKLVNAMQLLAGLQATAS